MDKNICRFTPYHSDSNMVHIINFVLETKKQIYSKMKLESVYKIHYVYSGHGFIHTQNSIRKISAGDIFFTFPSMPFCIESRKGFSYIYISFLGKGGQMLLDRLNISINNYIFKNFKELGELWENGLKINENVSDLACEGILHYTLSVLANTILSEERASTDTSKTFLRIKKYIDDNFSNPALSLESIANELHYNPKYISGMFKKNMNVGFSSYLNTLRIQHSCTMINHGYTSVSDIAMLCGYTDSHYFSKVFKEKIGVSPRDFINKDE